MHTRFHKLTLLAGVAVFALSACSTTTSEPAEGTVQLQADYPSYDIHGLIEEATLIVEGTALATEPTVLMPRYEGATPEENPLLGLSEDEKKRAIKQDDGVPATAVAFRVDVVHQGVAEPGQEITIIQTGGVIDGVTYQVQGETMLATDESYLLCSQPTASTALSPFSAARPVRSFPPGMASSQRPTPRPRRPSGSPPLKWSRSPTSSPPWKSFERLTSAGAAPRSNDQNLVCHERWRGDV